MRALGAIAVAGIVVAIAIALAFTSTTSDVIAMTIGGLACVLGVSVVFYAVGRSEDRDRAGRGPDD
jgi:uncharacterized membrane protein